MLIYVESKGFLGKTFTLTCERSDTVARVKALLLHVLHDIGRGDHYFRLKFGDVYLREPLTVQDYNLVEMSVLQMVPVSFGKCARAQTTATGVRPFTAAGTTPLDNGSSFSARTISALRREVDIFKRRRHMLEVMKALLWFQLGLSVGNFVTIYWWSGFWTGLVMLLAVLFQPTFVQVGGSVGRMTQRDIYLMVAYSVCFTFVALSDLVMFLYILLALLLPRCPSSSAYYDSTTSFDCSYQVWFSTAFFLFQTLILSASAVLALILQANFRFEAGKLVEHTLTQARDINELLEIAENGRSKDKRQVALELSNIALLGDTSKNEIAAAGGLQVLISLAASEDEVTQEYATEGLAEFLTLSSLQADFITQGGVATLCALLHSLNGYIVHQAACALSYLTAESPRNRMAVVQDKGLDDLLQAYSKDIPEVQQTVTRILLDLAACDEASAPMLTHVELLGTLIEMTGSSDSEVMYLSLQTLERLARRNPETVLQRPHLIPHLLGCTVHDVTVATLLLLFAEDKKGSQQLLSHSNLLTSLQDLVTMTTTNPDLALLLVSVVHAMMKQPQNRTKLVLLRVRGFLDAVQSHCSHLTEVQALVDESFKLLLNSKS